MSDLMREQICDAKRFARRNGLTLFQAQALILVIGNDLAKLSAAAKRLRGVRAN